jgi:hypothetical protein
MNRAGDYRGRGGAPGATANTQGVRYLTAARVAVVAAFVAVLGQAFAPSTLVSFYVTAVCAAALIAAAMVAYMDTVDGLTVVTGAVLGLTSVAATLLMIDAAVSFPGALSAESANGPGALSLLALVLSVLALVGDTAPRLLARYERSHHRPLRELLSR